MYSTTPVNHIKCVLGARDVRVIVLKHSTLAIIETISKPYQALITSGTDRLIGATLFYICKWRCGYASHGVRLQRYVTCHILF